MGANGSNSAKRNWQIFPQRALAVSFLVEIGEALIAGRVKLDKKSLKQYKQEMMDQAPPLKKRPASASCSTLVGVEPPPKQRPASASSSTVAVAMKAAAKMKSGAKRPAAAAAAASASSWTLMAEENSNLDGEQVITDDDQEIPKCIDEIIQESLVDAMD